MSFQRKRRRSYREKKTLSWNGRLLVTVLVCALLLFCAAIMLGHYLGTLVPESTDTVPEGDTTERPPDPTVVRSHIITGKAVTFNSVLEAKTDTEAPETDGSSGTPAPVQSVSYDAVSILLRYPEMPVKSSDDIDNTGKTDVNANTSGPAETDSGEPFSTGMILAYTSPVVQAACYETPGDVNVRDGIAALRLSTGIKYVSGVFCLSYPSLSGKIREDIRDYEMSLLYELFEYGISEVVLCGYGSSDLDGAEAAIFAKELRARSGEKCVVGIALPFEFFSESSSNEKLRAENAGNAFFAMDLFSVQVPGMMSEGDVIFDKVRRTISLAVAYNIRVVVGCGEHPDADLQVREAIRGGATNVQGILKY